MHTAAAALTVAFITSLFWYSMAPGATDTRLFPFTKDVTLPTGAAKKVAVFSLDEEIFASTDDRYSNMRLFDDKDNEKPFLVRTARTTKTETTEHMVEMETVGFQKLPDNRVEMIYSKREKDRKRLPSVIVFVSALKNYEKQVTIWGSNDRDSWQILVENQPIFDYSKFIALRNCRIEINAGNFTYYKINVSNITENQQSPLVSIARETRNGSLISEVEKSSFRREDFRIDRVDFFEKKETAVRDQTLKRLYSVSALNVTNNVKEKTTVITFETCRTPIMALKILTGSSNFSRSIKIECPEDRAGADGASRYIVSSSISRIDVGGFKQENTQVALGSVIRNKRYRITISNQDSPPLDISGIEAEGEICEAVFFPEQSVVLRTMYGAKSVDIPSYDIAQVLAKVESADADVCSVTMQKTNPAYVQIARRYIEGRKLLLVAVLLVVVGLVWVIARASRSVDSTKL